MKFKFLLLLLLFTSISFSQEKFRFNINNIDMPMDNQGTFADVLIGYSSGGMLDGGVFLFSGGFVISGKRNDSIFTNAVFSAHRFNDYAPGNFSSPNDPKAHFYILDKRDGEFSDKWLAWKDAVSLGANFYDGDNDGIYNPVDLNSNGKWDKNEDRPDLLGDVLAWCVYSDTKTDRKLTNMKPVGIEIRQSVFGYRSLGQSGNFLFVRYELNYNPVNISDAPEILDSIYFSITTDPDLGDPYDDFAGCDTILNSGYVYNEGPDADPKFGSTPPSFLINYLQGPPSFIPGETFIDLNSNGVFDLGETALDTAYNHLGFIRGVEKIPAARNLGLTSFTHVIMTPINDPMNAIEYRNHLKGLVRSGLSIPVCTWPLSKVAGANCSEINSSFWYSGDPTMNTGWLNSTVDDKQIFTNTGPFQLKKNMPVSIIVAYNVARGSSALSSLNSVKNISKVSKNFYDVNFDQTLTRVNEDKDLVVNNFSLEQNFPNPFNPSTTIKYIMAEAGEVKLEVFDVLGNLVETLVNEYQQAGNYQIEFNLSKKNLTSGIYFYRMKTRNFVQTKKMTFLK